MVICYSTSLWIYSRRNLSDLLCLNQRASRYYTKIERRYMKQTKVDGKTIKHTWCWVLSAIFILVTIQSSFERNPMSVVFLLLAILFFPPFHKLFSKMPSQDENNGKVKIIVEGKKRKFPWAWVFTIFIFYGAYSVQSSQVASMLLIMGGIFISPPANKLMKKHNIYMNTKAKIIVMLILLLLAGYAIPNELVWQSYNNATIEAGKMISKAGYS